jgi:diadenosine tetraphosphatase ApaH/serine/threonine PP2A family protein phosphatase
VHGNLPAFEAVLDHIARTGVDETWCLGDLVGYGAQPDACVTLARESCDLCLIGNHDLVALGKLDVADFSAHAAIAAVWTREQISEETRTFLESLAPENVTKPIGLYHASPRDPIWEYVLSALLADDCMDAMEPRVGAIGHSHVALSFWRTDGSAAEGAQAPAGTELDLAEGEWLINPGSVGQPRDGDARAAWLLLDLEDWRATWQRVDYPIDDAASAIRHAGLPDALAERLYYGQ